MSVMPAGGADGAWRDHGLAGEGPSSARTEIAPREPRRQAADHLTGAPKVRRIQPNRTDTEAGRFATASRTGLELSLKMTFDKWLSIGRDLAITANSAAWWLGDWLIYGETAFTGRYRSAIEQTSLDYKTLRNYAWVARRFAPERRREGLSFGHHAEVAALSEPEQNFWLRKAETLGWSRNELRHGVRASLREREETGGERPETDRVDDDPDTDDGTPPVLTVDGAGEYFNVQLTPQQLDVIRQAASSAQVTIDIWVTRILEQAALRVVNSIGRENAA
jgi:hypothetical protein